MSMIGGLLKVSSEDLENMLKDSSIFEERIHSEDTPPDDKMDLDRSWEGIYYLLTGAGIVGMFEAKPPLSWAFLSGQVIDEAQDLGCGPAHYITADQVRELNAALDSIDEGDLRERFDGERMNEANIYPECWEENEALDYLMDSYNEMKAFYIGAEQENKAVITYIYLLIG